MRIDSGVAEGSTISGLYDPMIAKLVVWDEDRELARKRMLRALSELEIEGPKTLIPLHRQILEHPDFIAGGLLHEFVEREAAMWTNHRGQTPRRGAGPRAGEVDDAACRGRRQALRRDRHRARARRAARACASAAPRSPSASAPRTAPPTWCEARCRGPSSRSASQPATPSRPGDVLIVVEAMKMENEIVAHHPGAVEAVEVAAGDQVSVGQALVRLGAT